MRQSVELDIVCYDDLIDPNHTLARATLENALLQKGIVGIKNVPGFVDTSRTYIDAVRQFCALDEAIKNQYAPDRDSGVTEGYELGAEWFKDKEGNWKIDDKKASYYAYVPDRDCNKWPLEVDLKTPYLALGNLIFQTGKVLLDVMQLNESVGIVHEKLAGYGRMLHYHKESDATNENPFWCGAHLDHGVFTGLIPAYYYRDGQEVDEPEEAGLYIATPNSDKLEKINASDKSILLFQVGEFGQLVSNDRISATRHTVKKANGGIERFTFALFYSADDDAIIETTSTLKSDARYQNNKMPDGRISYGDWQRSSFERYRAK